MLQPCAQCNRHVHETETRCPFCGAANEARPRAIPLLEGRLSRAAVFASTLVAAPACVVNEPPPQYVQQPPYQQPPPNYQQPPPNNNGPDQGYAQPPPDDQQSPPNYGPPPPPDPPPPVNTAGVDVVVLWNNGQIYQGQVQLHGPTSYTGATNPSGVLNARNLPPGTYTVTIPNPNPRIGPIQQTIVLQNGAVKRIDIRVPAPVAVPYDRHQHAKPYGAPPMRRRVV